MTNKLERVCGKYGIQPADLVPKPSADWLQKRLREINQRRRAVDKGQIPTESAILQPPTYYYSIEDSGIAGKEREPYTLIGRTPTNTNNDGCLEVAFIFGMHLGLKQAHRLGPNIPDTDWMPYGPESRTRSTIR